MKHLWVMILTLLIASCANKGNAVKASNEQAKKADTEIKALDKAQQEKNTANAAEVKHIQKIEKTDGQKERIKIKSEQENIEEDQPLAVIANYTKKLRSYVDQPNSKNREDSIAQQVREFFNFEELAKRSLGRHWNTQSEKNKKQFSDLFIQLVEGSYLKRSRQIIGDYEVTFKNQKIKGDNASVTSTVSQQDANIDIKYDLLQKGKQWMIYNITLDDVNLVRTYQSQFNKIIKDKGFPHLISLMKKRVEVQEKDDIAI
ncbi:MAG TPA: ABC transporter substrate-binding protein [Oligoflexia bacterium]|nr:ABC transporter substrate-binding protein [Oligoflexia bacterium]HMR25589.1 ABC transporter substrate-binding protein [Oligoflexia bacterium]